MKKTSINTTVGAIHRKADQEISRLSLWGGRATETLSLAIVARHGLLCHNKGRTGNTAYADEQVKQLLSHEEGKRLYGSNCTITGWVFPSLPGEPARIRVRIRCGEIGPTEGQSLHSCASSGAFRTSMLTQPCFQAY